MRNTCIALKTNIALNHFDLFQITKSNKIIYLDLFQMTKKKIAKSLVEQVEHVELVAKLSLIDHIQTYSKCLACTHQQAIKIDVH